MRVDNEKQLIPLNLAFFADQGEKTEAATPRRRRQARERGQVALSQEVSTALMLIGAFFALSLFASWIIDGVRSVFHISFGDIARANYIYNEGHIVRYLAFMFWRAVLAASPMLGVALLLGVAANLGQVGWKATLEPMRPKLSKLNPLTNLKSKVFSSQAIANLLKALFKFVVILSVLYVLVANEVGMLPQVVGMSLESGIAYFGGLTVRLGLQVGALFIFIALADLAFTRHKHSKQLRMSKLEVKQEHKQQEGDLQIKARIRQRMREASARRMMKDLTLADVLITNPTHFAVAIKYDKQTHGDAPIVVAKGADQLAKRIKEAAKEHRIHIVENVELARALYAKVPLGRAIPPELYQAVAEVLAFVYNLRDSVATRS